LLALSIRYTKQNDPYSKAAVLALVASASKLLRKKIRTISLND
jgi:hypothetical protein